MLFPYIREPDTASLIPSRSVGGAAIKARIKQIVAVKTVGIRITPNHPTYNLLFVEVTQEQNCSQILSPERRVAIVAVIRFKRVSI
jgi:hypothetical protein